MKKIGVLTSGGDSPGMNAAVRAVVRAGIHENMRVMGIRHGYAGLIAGEIEEMDDRSVSEILHKGGTMLYTARCLEFKEEAGFKKGLSMLDAYDIEGLVVIGGDGSFRGALKLHEAGIKTVGIPGTIDNDIDKTDYTIGFDTALNIALEALNRLRDTASSHERAIILEVMGRNSGWIAMETGIAGGAEIVLVPEVPLDVEAVCETIKKARIRGKKHCIIVLAEGVGHGFELAKMVEEKSGYECRVTVLGHVQRGGPPTAFDRLTASKFGVAAVKFMMEGKSGVMTALRGNRIEAVPIEDAVREKKNIDLETFKLAEILG